MSRVMIDCRMLAMSGIGTYLQAIVPRVVAGAADIQWVLLGDPYALRALVAPYSASVTIMPFDAPIYGLSEQLRVRNLLASKPDVFWSPHYNIPLAWRGKLLVTIHDILHVAMPEFVGGWHRRFYARFMLRRVVGRAAAIMCDSAFTSDEIGRHAGGDSTRRFVVHLGIDSDWYEATPSEQPARPYLLYVGNVKPHKNLARLIAAFRSLSDTIPHDLLLVGKREGFITGDANIAEAAADLGDRVRFTGFVSDAELRRTVAGATVLVFPSLYEGFGLPPLEAMAAGVPVLASDAGSLPEICADAVQYCDPRSAESIAAGIREIISDPRLREHLISLGRQQARRYSWEITTRQTLAILRSIL